MDSSRERPALIRELNLQLAKSLAKWEWARRYALSPYVPDQDYEDFIEESAQFLKDEIAEEFGTLLEKEMEDLDDFVQTLKDREEYRV